MAIVLNGHVGSDLMSTLAIVVPLKSFAVAKERLRLSGVIDTPRVARALAEGVVRASGPRDVFVVTESDDVADFALTLRARVLRSPEAGLNEAVTFAYEQLSPRYDRIMVAHGDLRDPAGLGTFEPTAGVTIVCDHRGEGTNVLVVPAGLPFNFHFGPTSRQRHREECVRLELPFSEILTSPWRFDVDERIDLET